jgi:hypothetical protein
MAVVVIRQDRTGHVREEGSLDHVEFDRAFLLDLPIVVDHTNRQVLGRNGPTEEERRSGAAEERRREFHRKERVSSESERETVRDGAWCFANVRPKSICEPMNANGVLSTRRTNHDRPRTMTNTPQPTVKLSIPDHCEWIPLTGNCVVPLPRLVGWA